MQEELQKGILMCIAIIMTYYNDTSWLQYDIVNGKKHSGQYIKTGALSIYK